MEVEFLRSVGYGLAVGVGIRNSGSSSAEGKDEEEGVEGDKEKKVGGGGYENWGRVLRGLVWAKERAWGRLSSSASSQQQRRRRREREMQPHQPRYNRPQQQPRLQGSQSTFNTPQKPQRYRSQQQMQQQQQENAMDVDDGAEEEMYMRRRPMPRARSTSPSGVYASHRDNRLRYPSSAYPSSTANNNGPNGAGYSTYDAFFESVKRGSDAVGSAQVGRPTKRTKKEEVQQRVSTLR